ncbi:MAG: MBL fold metallo-hydrolase [Longimicrobiales bacterium]|nr:MBL fold metallo-hydrolase [Longimicrobiales bacterium]
MYPPLRGGVATLPLLLLPMLPAASSGPVAFPVPVDPAAVKAAAVTARDASRTRLVLLGTGTPNPDPDRSGPALAVVVDSVPYLVDAGPGVVRRAAQAATAGEAGLRVDRLDRVFLTHLHSDHTAGLPDLLLTPWVLDRSEPLEVLGPPGTERMMTHLREAYLEDIHMRLFGLEPANDGGHRVRARDVEPGVVYRDERVTVTAIPVVHGSWPAAYGYRFDTPDMVIVISGDAAPSGTLAEACDGCDILVHEVYARAGWERRDPVWQRYHAAFHTSGYELGELATRARPARLVLTHQLLWGVTPEVLLAEVRSRFAGEVIYGNDLEVFR